MLAFTAMKLLVTLLASVLLQARPAFAVSSAASVYYFDHEYSLRFDLALAVEEIIRSTSSIKLERTSSGITYTDGARFVIDRPEDLTADELNRTTDYADTGPAEVLQGGHSVLLPPQDMMETFAPAVEEKMSAYFSVERQPARLMEGTSPSGIKFKLIALPQLAAKPLWEPTLQLRHYASMDGRELVFNTISVPMGLSGLNRKMIEQASDKRSAVLLSLGTGGKLAGSALNSGPGRTLGYLAAAGTDIAAVEPQDLKNFWRWSREDGGIKLSSAAPEFICTNIKISEPELAKIIKPYALRTIGGVTVAFISLAPFNAAVQADLQGTPFEITDPKDEKALYSVINELRGVKKAKLVVAVSFLSHEELGRLMEARGIDALIGPKTWDNESGRRTRVELRKWEKETHTGPALTVFPDSRGSGELRAEFGPRGALTALESLPPPQDERESFYYREQISMKERIIRQLLGSGDALLPGLGSLGADAMYGIPDFFNMAAGLVRKAFSAEISVLKVSPFSSSVPGDIPSAMVKTWLGPDEPVALVLAPGFFLSDFINKAVPARDPSAYYSPQAYEEAEYYAVSGLDSNGMISGLPVNRTELYLAALPESLIKGKPFIRRLKAPAGAPGTIYETVVAGLKALKERYPSHSDWETAAWCETKNITAPRDIWHINLRNLSLEMVDTSVSGPAAYSGVSESLLSADSQTRGQGSARLFSEYYSGRFRFDSGIAADYGKTVLRPRGQPRITSESVDELLYQNELVYKVKNYNGKLGRLVMGPYASAAYDTEFSRNDGVPLRKVLRGGGGIKLFEGAVLQELYAGLTTEQIYTYSPVRTKFALETGFRLSTPLPGTALQLSADGTYRNFARSRFDTVYDLKDRLELNLKVSTRLYGDIMISPFVNYFRVTGKKLPGSGVNLTTGFSLDYSCLFKITR